MSIALTKLSSDSAGRQPLTTRTARQWSGNKPPNISGKMEQATITLHSQPVLKYPWTDRRCAVLSVDIDFVFANVEWIKLNIANMTSVDVTLLFLKRKLSSSHSSK